MRKRKRTGAPEAYRKAGVSRGTGRQPASYDPAAHSLAFVVATEAPVPMYDPQRGEVVPEILLASGCSWPGNGQVPLLDSHNRFTVDDQLGAVTDLRVSGRQVLGLARFDPDDPKAQRTEKKYANGTLTDFSAGYRINPKARLYIGEGETRKIAGQTYTGPVNVVTSWHLMEASCTPIGADADSKARGAATTRTQEDPPMNKKLRAYLEQRGLAADATEAQAWAFLSTLSAAEQRAAFDLGEPGATDPGANPGSTAPGGTEPGATDPKAQARAMAASDRQTIREAELARVRGLQTLAARFGVAEETLTAWIDGEVSEADAQRQTLDLVAQRAAHAGGDGLGVRIVAEDRDKFRDAAEESLEIRAGRVSMDDAQHGGDELANLPQLGLFREFARFNNLSVRGDVMTLAGRALTTSEFANILANTANKSMLAGYDGAESTHLVWTDKGSLPDFKTATLARAGDVSALVLVDEDGEFTYGKRSDTGETVKLATYGLIVPITRQTLINDDMGALTDTPQEQGESARMLEGDLVYAVLTSNAALGDGTALFHADHSNLLTGAAPSFASFAAMRKAMRTHKDLLGVKRLNIPLRHFIAPEELWETAEPFFASELLDVTSGSKQTNPVYGQNIKRVYESRLDDNSTTAWYGAGPVGKTVRRFYLNGNDRPYLESRDGWTIDGTEMKVRLDLAVAALGYRALAKNPGA